MPHKPPPGSTLPAREARFVAEYLIDRNGPRAYAAAGYSKRSARNGAYVLLKKPQVQAALAEGQAKILAKTTITHERVLDALGVIAFDKQVQAAVRVQALRTLLDQTSPRSPAPVATSVMVDPTAVARMTDAELDAGIANIDKLLAGLAGKAVLK